MTDNQAPLEGIFALREQIRRIMREGIEGDTSLVAADLMREVVEWATARPDDYAALLAFVQSPRFQSKPEEN